MEFYFKDSRFSFSLFGDSAVRIVSYCAYIILGAAAFILSFSDISRVRAGGFLLAIFLIDRLIQSGKGERTTTEFKRGKMNVARAFAPRSLRFMITAFRAARATGSDFYLRSLVELIKDSGVRHILKRLNIKQNEFSEKLLKLLNDSISVAPETECGEALERVMLEAYRNAVLLGESYVEPRNLFAALTAQGDSRVAKLLYLFDVSPGDIRQAVLFSRHHKLFSGLKRTPRALGEFAHIPRRKRKRHMNRAWTARPTPLLDSVSTDLTELAERGRIGLLVGHEREYEALIRTISKPGKPNAVLVGEPGIGKTTVIERLAERIVKDEVPKILFDKRLVSLELSGLLSDANEKEMSGRLRQIIDEIKGARNVVLVIPHAHDLFRGGNAKEMTPIDFFLPVVKNDGIPVICETSPKEWKTFIEPRADFVNQFEKVDVQELSEEEAGRFLIYESFIIEREFKIFITWKAIKKSVELARRYFRDKPLPGSASDLLKQAAAFAREERLETLSEEPLLKVAEQLSKIPIRSAGEEETEKLLNLESIIHERFINQKEAVLGVARSLREYRSGLSRVGGPIATFLFVGPTGVGKTELAKMIAEVQFGNKEFIRRFDMTEYREKGSIQRLIGTPDGEKTGILTDAILQNPYSLVLLDEFEKAHPDILNLFLQVFDDGRLTDSHGRTVGFENTVIIATSNASSDFIKEEIEKGTSIETLAEKLKSRLTEHFSPELLNRFSQIIVFKSLTPEELEKVVILALEELQKTLERTQGIVLRPDISAVKKLAELGWSPVFGARPLRGVISEKIRSTLAEKILKKEIGRGNVVSVLWDGKSFRFILVE